MQEKRQSKRYKAVDGLNATISAEDSDLSTEGTVLNISKAGAYVLADSIPFQAGQIIFQPQNGSAIQRGCRRIDPHHAKARGMAVAFTDMLSDDQLNRLMAPIPE